MNFLLLNKHNWQIILNTSGSLTAMEWVNLHQCDSDIFKSSPLSLNLKIFQHDMLTYRFLRVLSHCWFPWMYDLVCLHDFCQIQSVFAMHSQLYIIVLPTDSRSRNFRHLVTVAQVSYVSPKWFEVLFRLSFIFHPGVHWLSLAIIPGPLSLTTGGFLQLLLLAVTAYTFCTTVTVFL